MAADRPRKPVVPMMFPSQMARRGPGLMPEATEPPEPASIEISLGPKEGSAPARVYVFRQPKVTVGRSSACDLRLDDPDRLASSRHAEISTREGALQIKDLGSRNSTFVNGERLEPDRAYDLEPDDEIVISGARLGARLLATEPTGDQGTIVAPGGLNPFTANALELAEALRGVAETWRKTAPQGRAEGLAEALAHALGGASDDAYLEIGRWLSRSDDDPDR